MTQPPYPTEVEGTQDASNLVFDTHAPSAGPLSVLAASDEAAGIEELKALDKRSRDRGMEYLAATKEETSPEKLTELAKRLPANDPKFIDAFFELEKRYRSKDVGLFALNFVVMRAAQVGNPDMAVVHGRERALGILRQHYLTHEDLDWPLMSLLGGPVPFGAEEVLKTISEKSPHEHVRATALLMWAASLKQHADIMTSRKSLPPAKAPESALDKLALEQDRKMLERLLKLHDEMQARKEAERLAKRVLAEYPKVAVPVREAGPEGPYAPRRFKKPIKGKSPTYAEQAEALLFDLTQLVVGQATPPLVGRDSEGKEFRLSDCKGKVVVLMFSANWCAPCKGFYPTLRDLQKKFDGKPFVVVTVMADSELKTVRQAIDKGDITWRTVWDGEQGPIASKWNVTRFPTLYVFDQRGIIRFGELNGRELETIVAGLLKEEK